MRKASTLVGLTLFALASTARAEEAAPTASSTAPAASESAAAPAASSSGKTAKASPAEEPTASELVAAQPRQRQRRLQIGLSFIPMAAGTIMLAPKGVPEGHDAYFAYGFAPSIDYRIFAGLSLGLTPQATLNVRAKDDKSKGKQIDLMLRVAYTQAVAEKIRLYAEVLPGYSIILTDDQSKGLVVAGGVGVIMDFTDGAFANLGVGYEKGFQKFNNGNSSEDHSTRYVRVALGGGVRF